MLCHFILFDVPTFGMEPDFGLRWNMLTSISCHSFIVASRSTLDIPASVTILLVGVNDAFRFLDRTAFCLNLLTSAQGDKKLALVCRAQLQVPPHFNGNQCQKKKEWKWRAIFGLNTIKSFKIFQK